MFETPVLFIVYNRPQLTLRSFSSIRQQQPPRLYIAADGPKGSSGDDQQKCNETRQFVLDSIDWKCDVKTFFRNENAGCGLAVSEAITWFFTHEERGIILEDDCIANTSFFGFCQDLLIKYADENKIMMITGCSFQKTAFDNYTYHYSRYIHVWGWATWRRAWNNYEFKPNDFDPTEADQILTSSFKRPTERKLWVKSVTDAINGKINTWDYQWMYAIWKNNGLSIVPWKNLISNVGYGETATHTVYFDTTTLDLHTHQVDDIKHPEQLKLNKQAEKYISYNFIISKHSILRSLKQMAIKFIKRNKYV